MTTMLNTDAPIINHLPRAFKDSLPSAAIAKLAADAAGREMWLLPPLVDLCARLREPGQQQHGTLESEGRAARGNGFLHGFPLSLGGGWMPCSVFFCRAFRGSRKLAGAKSAASAYPQSAICSLF